MKKFIMLVAFVFMTIATFAQEKKVVTYKNMYGIKNIFTDSYEYESRPTFGIINFYLSKGYIRVDDLNRSRYRITSDIIESNRYDYDAISYVCKDQNNIECVFTIMQMKDGQRETVISVMYEKTAFVYYILK